MSKARMTLGKLREMSARMAEDDGLWFIAQTAAEAYLQQELRKLCAAIEEVELNPLEGCPPWPRT